MAFPWLRVIDAALGFTNMAQWVKRGAAAASGQDLPAESSHPMEARLAGVLVAALKETFDRDHQRLALERERAEAERARVIRAERLALVRAAADRELNRLRVLCGLSVAGWLVPLIWANVLLDGGTGARVALGAGWLLLVSALAAALAGQVEVGRAVESATSRITRDEGGAATNESFVTGSGTLASSLLIAGFVAIALSALLR